MDTDSIDTACTDSAVAMDTKTGSTVTHQAAQQDMENVSRRSPSTDRTLSEKMRQLAAVAWTLEQDECMPPSRRSRIQEVLAVLEKGLEAGENNGDGTDMDTVVETTAHIESRLQTSRTVLKDESNPDEEEWMDEQDLIDVQSGIASTLRSMRLRQEEQVHLHHLTVNKIEAVAQRCIAQEKEMETLLLEMRQLRAENVLLHAETEQLRDRVSELQSASAQREVAVHAMSSAVKGLEGWIDDARLTHDQTSVRQSSGKRQKVVTRGKGRFRGRYYVDENEDGRNENRRADVDIHDGVKAWLRGFRDVEEELRQHDLLNRARTDPLHRTESYPDDDWGEFQGPAG